LGLWNQKYELLLGMKFLSLTLTTLCVFLSFYWTQAQNPYRIPVVVHVIHADGAENITDEQIKNGIEILTRNWRKQNPDTLEIVSIFKPIAADMEVEFELAKLDPNGACTNGINRIRSEYTLTGTHNVKTLAHWPPNKYLNVYVVREAAGLAGHALMPFQADSIPAWDGIVISGSYFGNIGTSSDLTSVVLSHEVGHYLNLFHIWGGNNVPEFYYLPVGQQNNCAVGDSVSDTPNTKGWSTCNLNGTSCDADLDNVQNFMDYAYCARMFTQGQKQRVHAALNSPVANRNNLWTAQNLQETGLSINVPLCVADFYSERRIYCLNEQVKFYDASYNNPTSWTWNVGSGSSLTGANVSYTYSESGKYDVSLNVSDGTNQLTLLRENYVKILEPTGLALPYIEGFESYDNLGSSPIFTECEVDLCYELENTVAASGQKSVVLRNHSGRPDLLYKLTTPSLNLSTMPNPMIRFKYAFAQKGTNNTDKLLVRMSKDCGKTWITRKTITSAELSTISGTVNEEFVPQNPEWAEVVIPSVLSAYKVDNVLIKFEFYSGGGSHFYLDDIQVFDVSQLAVNEPLMEDWFIAPNPAMDAFRIESPFASQDVDLYGMDGKTVWSKSNIPSGESISVAELPTGIYQVKLSFQGLVAYRKLIKL
jgi:PKD repeat protein